MVFQRGSFFIKSRELYSNLQANSLAIKRSCKRLSKAIERSVNHTPLISPYLSIDTIFLSWLGDSTVCVNLSKTSLPFRKTLFKYSYSFHRLLIEQEGCLQNDSFQHFHNPFFRKRALCPLFFKYYEKCEANKELLKLI